MPTKICLVLLVAFVGAIGVALLKAQEPTSAAIDRAVRAAVLTDMTILEVPAGDTPGHVSDQTVADLHDRLATVLPTVYAGDLLALKLSRLSAAIDVMRTNATTGQNTDAGLTRLSIASWPVLGSHAELSGSYDVWVAGRHVENGQLVSDRSEGSYSFTAGLVRIDGRWLVSSWNDQQLN